MHMKILLILGLLVAIGCADNSSTASTDRPTSSATPAATSGADGSAAPVVEPAPEPPVPAASSRRDGSAADAGASPRTAAVTETAPGATAPVGSNEPTPRFREVTIPAGTTLPLTLRTSVASDTSNLEDQVRGTLRRAITIEGVHALPAGTALIGHVTNVARSAKVKGRARIAFRFTRADLPGEGGVLKLRTNTVSRVAPATKKRDAATIGGGAVGGAIVGGILGGGDGAAKGAVIGGAGGTGVVLATRGREVRLPAGTAVSVKLAAPVTVRVPVN